MSSGGGNLIKRTRRKPTKGIIVQLIKWSLMVVAVAVAAIPSFAWADPDVLDLVVITARKYLNALLCDYQGNCVYDLRVPGPGGTTDGAVAAVDIGLLKNVISAIDLPCKPSPTSEADYIKGAVGMCVAKAAAAYSAAFGVTIGGFSMIVTQSQCNTKVQLSVGDGSAACKTA